jgi:DNA-binding MarR family transcriptional regulator
MGGMPHRTSKSTNPGGEPARWLSAEEVAAWRSVSRMMARLSWALEGQLQRDAGLSFTEYHALAMLSEVPTHTRRMSELAELTNASLSRLSHLVTRLERRNLIRREPDRDDGRYTNAVLTEEGLAQLVANAPAHVNTVRDLVVDPLGTDDLLQMGAAADRIIARIDGANQSS